MVEVPITHLLDADVDGAVAGQGDGSFAATVGVGVAGTRNRNSGIGGTSAPAPVGFHPDLAAHSAGGSDELRSTTGAPGNLYPPRTFTGEWCRLIRALRSAARFAFARFSK